MSSRFSFDPSNIDFASSKARLVSALSKSDTWRGVAENQVGTALVDFMATINTFAQQRVLASFREAFPETAASDRASFALAALQGIRLVRNVPARCLVRISSEVATSIPPLTKFIASGNIPMFNKSHLFLKPNEPQEVFLYEGTIVHLTTEGIGSDFQTIIPMERDFIVSDEDVIVQVEDQSVQRVTDGLWGYRGQLAFQDSTLPDGRLMIRFGTGVFGYSPPSGSTIRVAYALTRGDDANSLGSTGESVNCPSKIQVRGTMLESLSGGLDHRPAATYKNVDAPNFGSFGSAVKKSQYLSTALEFPGVLDARTFAQREIDPNDSSWMNTFMVVPLVTEGWNASNEKLLVKFMEDRTMYGSRFFVQYPVARPVDVFVRVFCDRWSDLTSVRNLVENSIRALFQRGRGTLQKDFFLSTLSSAIRTSSENVRHFDIVRPSSNIIVSSDSLRPPSVVIDPESGFLPAGPHMYGVAASISQDESGLLGYLKMEDTTQVVVSEAGSSAIVSWIPLPNATEYYVFGRRSGEGQFGLLATIPTSSGTAWSGEPVSWVDTGSVSPGIAPLTRSDFQVQYVTLNQLVVTTEVANV